MTKFMDRLDIQIRLHLSVKHLLSLIIYNYGKIDINPKLEEWYKLSWDEFFYELKSAGITINNESDRLHLQETFDEHKNRVLFIEDELSRLDEIISSNKNTI
jgi:hypothetical protein